MNNNLNGVNQNHPNSVDEMLKLKCVNSIRCSVKKLPKI